jgi:pimeloyl-ACP methyl ester carboxylesterase
MRLAATFICAGMFALATGQCGCRAVRPCALHEPALAAPQPILGCEEALELARASFDRGCELEAATNPGCIEAFFNSAHWSWQSLAADSASEAAECYGDALHHLIFAAQRFGQLDPARGLTIYADGQSETIPATHRGFAWKSDDFQRLRQPPTGHEPLLTRRYCCAGLGVPLVVQRRRNDCDPVEARFFPEKSYFAATAVLRFDGPTPVLEFRNPLEAANVETDCGTLPLARDLSAPLAQSLDEAPRTYFSGFIEPGQATTLSRLTFLDPYQPGKVPVVLIHGLFSDPLSWADLVNDLRAAPGFSERFQLWVFRYPTGQGFLQSAAALRRELRAAVEQLDPAGSDPALRQMVLVGHSMGGLIAKLQVTHSDDLIWNRLAILPLDEIATTESTRALLAENCFFDPSPHVARVVFIASPHCGSLRSSEFVGRGAALFVEPSPEQAAIHEQLVRDNPGVFNPEFERRFPTSIDMLRPSSPLLAAMQEMRIGESVELHNIVGVSSPLSLDGPSDGVVSVHSAWHPGCQSVLAVGAPHVKVHRALRTSAEVWSILQAHAALPPLAEAHLHSEER